MSDRRAVIFANGLIPDPQAAQLLLKDGDFWIAADGGTRHALAFGRMPDVLIGDFDSLPIPIRESLQQSGTELKQFPAEKDQTDLELALQYAVRENFFKILILGGLGGRTDQTVANLSLLLRPGLQDRDVRMDDGREEALLISRDAALQGSAGDIVSLLPFGSEAQGVMTEGLRFPLRGETLHPHQTRGVSNRMTGTKATIHIEKGILLCIHIRV